MSNEYQKRTYRDGAAYDFIDYGWRDTREQNAWERLQATEVDYNRAVEATAAAIAACPSE